ncbi:MAG: DUF1565 domain-containing protein [Myxococcota bacterium]
MKRPTMPGRTQSKFLFVMNANAVLGIALLAALLQFLVPRSGWAADYYVSTAGSDSNSGSSQSPFLTIQRAVAAVSAGDRVTVREGRYGSFVIDNLHGKAGAPITFVAEAGKKVTIDRYLPGGHDVGTVRFSGKTSYIILDGFEITNTDPLIDATRSVDPNSAEDRATYVPLRDGNPHGRFCMATRCALQRLQRQ